MQPGFARQAPDHQRPMTFGDHEASLSPSAVFSPGLSGEQWARLDALFDDALEWPEQERSAWLDAACSSEPQLRAEIEAMLAAHEHGSGILDLPSPLLELDVSTDLAGTALDVTSPTGEAFAKALSDRYVLDRELGRGGMATVFVAHERKHERRVVLKVLNPAWAAISGRDRFAREVRIAARLSHPHIVPMLDSGQAAGLFFHVMPYMEGETLRARIARQGMVPHDESLTLLHDIAEALAYAHEEGVVHRDIKPENVFCAGEHAYVLDFGVARLLSDSDPEGDDNLTREGVTVGTPSYMAPEQRVGDPRMDHRVDIHAWGLLAHELFTGRLPETMEAGSRGHSAPELSALPPEVAALVKRCLAADPRDRPVTMRAVLHEFAAVERIPPWESGFPLPFTLSSP